MFIEFVDADGTLVTFALNTEELLECIADDDIYPRWNPPLEWWRNHECD